MFAMRVDHETVLQLLEERHAEELFALVERNRQHRGQLRRNRPIVSRAAAV